MRNPSEILKALSEHSKDSSYKFERLYRIFFNKQMFFWAYQRTYSKQGNMTAGVDGLTYDQMSIQRIDELIESLRTESYQPTPVRRVYIPKKNGKMRPLGVPSANDKLVQEVARMILEAIYEGSFENQSHGFRPNRSPHTAIDYIQHSFSGTKWFIEGDIKGFFDNINHDVLLNTLRQRIADERFLRLIRKFLRAGYIEDWQYKPTYSGTPQGGIISPILANVYLDRFDKYIKEYIENFQRGSVRQRRADYSCLKTKIYAREKKLKSIQDPRKREELLQEILQMRRTLVSLPVTNEMDPTYRRMRYVRYADDFLIGVIGSKDECEAIKSDISEYMHETLSLELSQEKTLITHAQSPANFLGFDIFVRRTDAMKRNCNGILKRGFNGKIGANIPSETVLNKLRSYDAIRIVQKDGINKWIPKKRDKLVGWKAEDIFVRYNTEIRGFYNYYSIANNVSILGQGFGYIMEYSLCCTLARKWNLTISQVRAKLYKDKKLMIEYKDAKGLTRTRVFYNEGFKKKPLNVDALIDIEPQKFLSDIKPSLSERLLNGVCELCGCHDELIMHQVRKLSELKPNTEWNRKMLEIHRKTLAVCPTCNFKILNYGK